MSKLEYKFPNMEQEAEAIKLMSPEQVGQLKETTIRRLEILKAACEDYFDKLIESYCHICVSYGSAYMDIPKGWGYLKGGQLICDKCISNWEKKFNEKPEINTEGDIEYEFSVPKDSTHRGQANFEFV